MTSLVHRGVVALADGGRLAYACSAPRAEARPVLVLRPLGGSIALWGRFVDRLALDRQVIAFDPRGVGGSTPAPWLHTTRAMAADARAVLAQLGLARVHVFGLSLGGMVASWLAADTPTRVDRLVLASTLPRPGALSHHAWRFARAIAGPGTTFELALIHHILSPEFRHAHPERVREIDALVRAHPTGRGELLALGLAAARHDIRDGLRAIRMPTLLLVGGRDPLVGDRADAELLHGITHATLAVIADSGHDLTLEQPDATAARVQDFLSAG